MNMLPTNSSRRFALPLAILLHLLLFYALSKQHVQLTQNQVDRPPLVITLLPFLASPKLEQKQPEQPRKEKTITPVESNRPTREVHLTQPAVQPATPPAVLPAPAQKQPEVVTPVSPDGTSLAQSALNAVGKMDKDERGGADHGLGLSTESGTLGSRLSEAIYKHGAYRAGVIEEHVYPDGRREEKIHTILGDYCITYESPANPTDGFDTIQRGYTRSVPHTCGHRFD